MKTALQVEKIKDGEYMKYNPNFHHRKSIRLKGYDYSKNAYYYVTICIQNREIMLFGEISNNKMVLNRFGEIALNNAMNICNDFNDVELDCYVIMPNHVHVILNCGMGLNNHAGSNNGCTGLVNYGGLNRGGLIRRGLINQTPTTTKQTPTIYTDPGQMDAGQTEMVETGHIIHPEHMQYTNNSANSQIYNEQYSWIMMKEKKQTLGKIIRHYKAKTTKIIHDIGFCGDVWQRNYYEHIVRNENDLFRIRKYIEENPMKWENDEVNPMKKRMVKISLPGIEEA